MFKPCLSNSRSPARIELFLLTMIVGGIKFMIEVKNLSKRFRLNSNGKAGKAQEINGKAEDEWFQAVRDVSFQCAPGQILGLLGPNGAGKTTTLRILSTALKPDSGKITINNLDIIKDPLRARRVLGFLSGTTGLYGRLTVRENIEYFGRLHGLSRSEVMARCDELLSQLEMSHFGDRQVDQLSVGMRQKCAIARSVVHRPQVIILDEPTTGLDVRATETLLNFMAESKKMGIPLIFSTHHLHEVEKLCDRVCIINRGETAFTGTTKELKEITKSGTIYDSFLHILNKEA